MKNSKRQARDQEFQLAGRQTVFEIMRKESGGTYGICVLRRDQPQTRPPKAFMFQAAGAYLKSMAAGEKCECASCRGKLKRKNTDAFVAVSALVEDPDAWLMQAFCNKCVIGKTDEDLAIIMRDIVAPGAKSRTIAPCGISRQIGHA